MLVMALPPDKRKSQRVEFTKAIEVKIVAIDGTWTRTCLMLDVSQTGAKLIIDSIGSLQLKEFFLLLSTTGAAYRRCELSWVNGEEAGVTFLLDGKGPKGR